MYKKIWLCFLLISVSIYMSIFTHSDSYASTKYYKGVFRIGECHINEASRYVLSTTHIESNEETYFSIYGDFYDRYCRSGQIKSGQVYEIFFFSETFENEDGEIETNLVPEKIKLVSSANTNSLNPFENMIAESLLGSLGSQSNSGVSYEWVCSGCGKSVSSPSQPISRTNECSNRQFSSHAWSNVGQSGNISFYCNLCGASVHTVGTPNSSTCRGGGQTAYHRWVRN